MKTMRLPDWLGIGCVKCGTSWLWREMSMHPEIFSPKAKELHYFNNASRRNIEGYMKRLGKAAKHQLTGEFTPDYFHHYESMHTIKEYAPKAKLITCFRHPLERAFSNWKHATEAGRFPTEKTFMQSFEFWRVRERSIYSRWLKRWWAVFPEEQIHIVWYEDIKDKPLEVLKGVYKFLGVDHRFKSPDPEKKFSFHYHQNEKDYDLQKPTPEQRQKWLNYYNPYTEELEKLTGRDLSSWKV